MTDLFILRHGESQGNTAVTESLDSALTDQGMRQSCLTAFWIFSNLKLKGAVGFSSPYLRSIQTSSVMSEVIGIPFTVDNRLREFRFVKKGEELKENGVKVPNRILYFRNIAWPIKEWGEDFNFFACEDIDEFIDRCLEFLHSVLSFKKVVVVSHGAPCVGLTELAMGKSRNEVKEHCIEATNLLHMGTKKDVIAAISQDKCAYISGMKNCGITYIKDNKVMYFGKVVFQ